LTKEKSINVIEAAKEGYRQYATFYGRASRRQFWMWMLFQFLISGVVGVAFLFLAAAAGTTIGVGAQDGTFSTGDALFSGVWGLALLALVIFVLLFGIASIVPQLAFEARRLHDANMSAWWLFLHLVPYVGTIAVLIMCCFRSVNGQSLYENEGRPRSAGFSNPTDNSNNQW
jgi:uncharacterized membrane protein YhaH (DUF805 family)